MEHQSRKDEMMRRRQHSKSGLFLIELMIAIVFFAVTTAVFLQVFVKSHAISQQADQLFHAQETASCVAEILGGATSDRETFIQELKTCYPYLQEAADGVYIYYDENWENTDVHSGAYMIAVSWINQDRMWNIEIRVVEMERPTQPEDAPIYTLALRLYCPQEGGVS